MHILQGVRLIKKNHVDLVHVNASTAYVSDRAAEIAGVPVVWHIRESLEKDLGICYTNKEYSFNILNKATRMIAISDTIKGVWNTRISPPISVVYDGVPVEKYYVERKSEKQKSVFSEKVINIGIYGRITEGKGQLFFFKGIKELVNLGVTNIHIFWAGKQEDPTYYRGIKNYIHDNGLEPYQDYIGEISDIRYYLSNLDIVCVCSKYEGFGRVTVESQLGGCIVLGADTGATTELIRDGENGYLYKQNDEDDFAKKLNFIIHHIEDAKKTALLAQKEAIQKYSIETDVNNVISIYNEILHH